MLYSTTYSSSPIAKLTVTFLAALAVATGGLYVGQWIPAAMHLPLAVLEIVLLLVMIFARSKKAVGYPLMYSFMLVSGATLYPLIGYYISVIGADAVLKAFALAAVSFSGVAIYAAKTKEDFSFLGGFLMLGAFALLGLLIIQWFIPFSSVGQMGIAALGILIFLGFTIYDINRLARYGFTEADIPMIVVNIYLDFINLFIYILRFFASDED
ncbi:Bax inhibitor-1/YccA family protein [Parageobacillus sp. VR-IP]|uniref:Bax inhibitor-1/YccA family protein n=1 Tax=Parageobacillus sp. VR-IP TaxID=2742205 RepID=UPI0015817E6B|nr:Bax inhibitor-1/YccA family protein [Parageobacillus sp. VR-IP]NUK31495.1 Bax inhibitor-1/YccA family protein [Parageobacillus sp. VR-IP]